MFTIRSPQPIDLMKFEQTFSKNQYLKVFYSSPTNKFFCIAQSFIPYNIRFLPSIHIAAEGKNILGFVILSPLSKPNNSWQIKEIFVVDEMRNEDLGEELVRYVLSVYGGFGIEHFLAEIDSRNLAALSLFQQCGFRRYAKVYFYQKSIDINKENLSIACSIDKEFLIRLQTNNDLVELEKLEVSSIPPELRPALGKSKEYFKERKDSIVIIDKSRGLIIGWAQIKNISQDDYLIELIASQGWTHLYEQFLNTLLYDYITAKTSNIKLTVKVTDYITELTSVLKKLDFLPVETKELLVKTVWQKVKERKGKLAKIGKPSIAPT